MFSHTASNCKRSEKLPSPNKVCCSTWSWVCCHCQDTWCRGTTSHCVTVLGQPALPVGGASSLRSAEAAMEIAAVIWRNSPALNLQWFWFYPGLRLWQGAQGAQWVQIRTGDSELLPVALLVVGAWLGSGLYVPIGAICLQIHLIISLYWKKYTMRGKSRKYKRFSSIVEVCVWREGCNPAFCSLSQIVFVFSVKLNCKNCLYNVKRL